MASCPGNPVRTCKAAEELAIALPLAGIFALQRRRLARSFADPSGRIAGWEGLLRRLVHCVQRSLLIRELLTGRAHQVIERVRAFVFDAIDEEPRRSVRATAHCAL